MLFDTEGILYRTATWIYRFVSLNLLYIVSCLGIITIYPATAALFGVVRQWIKKKEPGIFVKYRELFLENFRQSMVVGLIMTFVGAFLVADFYILGRIRTGINIYIFICVSLISLCFIGTVLYVFPLMVNSYYSSRELIVNAIKFALYKAHITLSNLIVLAIWTYICLRFNFFLVFFFFSIAAFITYWFAHQKIGELAAREKQAETEDDSC